MKYRIKILSILTLIFVSILSVGCKDDDDDENPYNENALALNASIDTLILSENKLNDIAITFSWNEGIDHGPDFTTSYLFKMDLFGNNFSKDPEYASATETETYDKTINTRSFTHEELNDLILYHWNIFPGDETDIEARIVAKLDGPKFVYPEIAYKTVNIKTYKGTPWPLYIAGSAAGAEDDPANAIPVKEVIPQRYYTWEGDLKAGGFKLICQRTAMLPSLNKGPEDNTFYERTEESQPDEMFTVDEDGIYGLILDRRNNHIEYGKIKYNKKVYILGNATSGQWNIGNAIPLKWEEKSINIFTFEGNLTEGEFKFPLSNTAWTPVLLAPENGTEINSNGVADTRVIYATKTPPDNKWKVTEAGYYKLTIDANDMTLKAEWLGTGTE